MLASVGASFIGLTVIVTVEVVESTVPSFTLYVNESVPLKFRFGAYVQDLLVPPVHVIVPFVVSVTFK